MESLGSDTTFVLVYPPLKEIPLEEQPTFATNSQLFEEARSFLESLKKEGLHLAEAKQKWKTWIIAQFCIWGSYIIPLFQAQALEIAYSGEAGETWKGCGVFFSDYFKYSFEGLFTATITVDWKKMRDQKPKDFTKMVQEMLQDYPPSKFPGMWSDYPEDYQHNSKKQKTSHTKA